MDRRRLCIPLLLILALLGAVIAAGSAAASSSANPKRGIASSRYESSRPGELKKLGANWAYNWSATPPPAGGPEWVPMIWGAGSISATQRLTALRRQGRVHYLLGFNEPDSGAQANMTPTQAAALWPRLEKTGLILGSPAPQVPTDGWLKRFMTLVRQRHLRVNFIALHYYQDFTNPDAVPELKQQLIAIHDAYHRPLWITEIGALDIRAWGEPMEHPPTTKLAASYMRHLFAMLDGLPFVQRYAWFTDDCWNDSGCRYGSLVDGRGRPTQAARTFRTSP